MSLGTSWEKSNNCAIDGHGLVRLILNCEGMGHSNPGVNKAFVEHNSFLEIFSCDLIFFTVEVIGADHKPADRVCGVVFNEVVSSVIKFAC